MRLANAKELLIGVCYRTPTSSVFGPGNDDLLNDLIQEIGSKHHVLMGDFNYPDIDWSLHSCLPTASKDCRAFLDCLDDNFLSQHVTVPTRKDSILDLINLLVMNRILSMLFEIWETLPVVTMTY